jgi:signal transduction histidine kinase
MTNAFRHAGATRIEASLKFDPRSEAPNLRDPALAGLVMRVADDGRGLNGDAEAGMGLAGMRDRVRLMGGSVKIDSPQGGGAVVEACFTRSDLVTIRENFPVAAGTKPEKTSNH